MKKFLRYIPPVHEIQKDIRFLHLMEQFSIEKDVVTVVVQQVLDEVREQMINEKWTGPEPGQPIFTDYLFSLIEKNLETKFSYTLKRVINGTGTIIHTNLGRARMSESAIQHVIQIARNYSNLEYNLDEGERGSRYVHVERLIREITGAEGAMVVNNNAAAVYLILKELAAGKEVIVSRGELVEIGGSFRISSIMEESGAKLIEVGTTNKTHLYDYERAINEETAMLMKVHTSNFKVIGFTKSVSREELVKLANGYENLIVYEDLGSGALYDFSKHGIGSEPVVGEVLKRGVDLVSFSGDKLLGGPQAGIIVGKKELIDRLKKNQLARVVRVDKMTLAALEGTLIDYLRGEGGIQNIPVIRSLLVDIESLKQRTEQFIKKIQKETNVYHISLQESISQVGGGTMPEVELPSYVAVIKHQHMSAEKLARMLRLHVSPSIIVRIQNEDVFIDLRCVTEEEEELIVKALVSLD